ncbi:hypothetical protein [Acetohalobium arabaticum]|uniref:FG-GAP repeat protein n=1 Tax=Acetohalobium arabaticum (strain ATCC 49924 / DSM 5501 / Z-7288) TaxID=574087 RepID=D9QUQ9_ACEAZ|nr:hypothetical protein [Acetohalobium arabaticum]ADL11968.1 conserved hypothetical protein [Acetohalobium arabaticum DSM 5501]
MKNNIKKLMLLSLLILVVTLGFTETILSTNLNIDKEALASQLELKENIEIITMQEIEVTGDGISDKVILLGSKVGPGESPFRDNLMVVVEDGENQRYLTATYDNFAGYNPELLTRDFTGDQVDDVMITANSGGSGGIYHHLIATFKDGEAEVIFAEDNNRGIEVTGQFIPDFKARLNFVGLDKEVILDISANKDEYIKQRIYNREGALVTKRLIRPYSYPFSRLEAVDYNNDGQYELRGLQKIVGTCGADKISEVDSIWSYKNQQWTLKAVEL